jgi:multiple sugar transport system substrate-binding protein
VGHQGGSLPLRKGTAEQAVWKDYQESIPGLSVFLAGLDGARTKPTNPAYPQVSEAMGQSLVAVLLKRSSPRTRWRRRSRRARESSPAGLSAGWQSP